MFMGQESKKKAGNATENLLLPFPLSYINRGLRYVLHACKTYLTACTAVSLRMNLRSSKHIRDNRVSKELNINLENYVCRWFVLYIV